MSWLKMFQMTNSQVVNYLVNKYDEDRLYEVFFPQFAHEQFAVECIVGQIMEFRDESILDYLWGSIIFYDHLIKISKSDKKLMFYDILHVYIDLYIFIKGEKV